VKEIIKTIIGYLFSILLTCLFIYLFFHIDTVNDIVFVIIGCTMGYWIVFFLFKTRKKSKN